MAGVMFHLFMLVVLTLGHPGIAARLPASPRDVEDAAFITDHNGARWSPASPRNDDHNVARSPTPARNVLWWLGSYNDNYVAENAAFIAKHNATVLDGVLHCCTGPTITADGALDVSPANAALFANLTRGEVAPHTPRLAPVMLPVSPPPAAVLAGVAGRAAPALAKLAVSLSISGFVVDYEPHVNETAAHARLFTAFLRALAAALHGEGKRLAVCVSSWTILAPRYYPLLATAKADYYISMGSTYGYQFPGNVPGELNVAAMKRSFPLGTIVVGIGSMAPTACGHLTGDYKWDATKLRAFLGFLAKQGVASVAVWRADIASLLYNEPHYCGVEPWMFPVLAGWRSAASGRP